MRKSIDWQAFNMAQQFSVIILLLGIVTVTTQINVASEDTSNNLEELQRLLQGLESQSIKVKYDKSPNTNSYKPTHHSNTHMQHEEQAHPNLMNIQTLNLFLKQNGRHNLRASESAEKLLQQEVNRICKTSRCGCSGTRCGNNRFDDVTITTGDEVEQLLNEFQKALEKDMSGEKGGQSLRCDNLAKCTEAKWTDTMKINDDNNEILNLLRCGKKRCCRGLRCGYDRNDLDLTDKYNPLRCSSDRCEREKSIDIDLRTHLEKHGQKFRINEDLDAIVLDVSNFGSLLSDITNHCKDGSCKIMKNNRMYRDKYDNDKDSIINIDHLTKNHQGIADADIEAVLVDLNQVKKNNALSQQYKHDLSQNTDVQERNEKLNNFYKIQKKTQLNDLQDNDETQEDNKLSGKQNRLLNSINYLAQKDGMGLTDKQIEYQIKRVLFGDDSNTKSVPDLQNFKATKTNNADESNLRIQPKRLFPLTVQQRNKLIQIKKPLRIWRKNAQPNVEEYGVPFELEVHGLGQPVP